MAWLRCGNGYYQQAKESGLRFRMGDRYYTKHIKKNPKRTPEQIEEDRIKRNEDKKKIRGY